MNPSLLRDIFTVIAVIGTFVAAIGGAGRIYFEREAQKHQPIRTVQANVDVYIQSDNPTTILQGIGSGSLTLRRDNQKILVTSATEYSAKQTGPNTTHYQAVFRMGPHDPSAGKPLSSLRQAELAEIIFNAIDPQAHVLRGTVVLTINSTVQLEINIPEQRAQKKKIFVENPITDLP